MNSRDWAAIAAAPKNTTATTTAEQILHEWALGSGGVMRVAMIEEAIALSTGNTVKNLATQLPALSRVLNASVNLDTAVTLATATAVGLGTTAAPVLLAEFGTMTKNAKTNVQPLEAASLFATATTIQIVPTNGSGTPAGTFNANSQIIRVRIVYQYITGLPNIA